MGLLVEGEALSPEETKEYLSYIRDHGVTQFLLTWNRVKDLHDDELRFGDEIECGIFVLDDVNKTVKLSNRGAEVVHAHVCGCGLEITFFYSFVVCCHKKRQNSLMRVKDVHGIQSLADG